MADRRGAQCTNGKPMFLPQNFYRCQVHVCEPTLTRRSDYRNLFSEAFSKGFVASGTKLWLFGIMFRQTVDVGASARWISASLQAKQKSGGAQRLLQGSLPQPVTIGWFI